MPRFTPLDDDMTMAQIMARWPATLRVINAHHLLCVGCAVAPFHTVAEACRAHGLDEAAFRRDLRAVVDRR